ncbi:hypothetical protein CRUP_027118 [Coryphaenoides rupestris]|nr:hypothetical protein CRUP_027118 [Coryphaenoides rupestris]
MKSQIANVFSDFFFEYETQRQVLVRSWRVGVVCRIIQLGVLAYIIGAGQVDTKRMWRKPNRKVLCIPPSCPGTPLTF